MNSHSLGIRVQRELEDAVPACYRAFAPWLWIVEVPQGPATGTYDELP